MSNDELKPTNEEIAKYIYEWIEFFDENGLIMVDDDFIKLHLFSISHNHDFSDLRKMFNPPMYNSIKEWIEAQEKKE